MSSGNIEVIKQLGKDLPKVMADGSQLQDVFLNLITNAEYSMKEAGVQGKLTIETRSTDTSDNSRDR